jgi:hypothetical protein
MWGTMTQAAEFQPQSIDPLKKSPVQWRRLITDILFGVIAPILSLILDPIVFRGGTGLLGSGSPVLPQFRVFAYVAIPIGVITLTGWLWRRFHLHAWSGFIGGILFAGALFSLLVGLLILPVTLFGIVLGIGLLGFIPFFTAIVLFRNAREAINDVGNQLNVKGVVASVVLGMVVAVAIPGAIHLGAEAYVTGGIEQVRSDDIQTVKAGTEWLKNAFWCDADCFRPLETAYEAPISESRRMMLAAAYRQITGRDIDWRTRYFSD